MTNLIHWTIIIIFFFAFETLAETEEEITIYYINRIPYMYKDDSGKFTGLVIDPVKAAFEKAGIPFKFSELPAKRHMKYLKENRKKICAIGWYKNAEREKFAKYSKCVYQNKSRIAIARNDNLLISSLYNDLDALLKNKKVTLLLKDGYSYGSYIDDKIKTLKPNVVYTTGESINMIKMLFYKRADYFFLSEEEADALIPLAGLKRSDFKYVHFRKMPFGLKRYILFPNNTDDSLIEKINKAISQL